MRSKLTLDDCIYLCMKNGNWWTFWTLQQTIYEKTQKFYGEPTISAGIRNLRKPYAKAKYKLPDNAEIIKRRIDGGKGYEYKLDGLEPQQQVLFAGGQK
tara:strand:+ start:574 stop:870 length:297 start_codon:yes stop_codon:yes gene_type:complete